MRPDEEMMKIEYELRDVIRSLKEVKEDIFERRRAGGDVEILEQIKRNLVSTKCQLWDRITELEIENYPPIK